MDFLVYTGRVISMLNGRQFSIVCLGFFISLIVLLNAYAWPSLKIKWFALLKEILIEGLRFKMVLELLLHVDVITMSQREQRVLL